MLIKKIRNKWYRDVVEPNTRKTVLLSTCVSYVNNLFLENNGKLNEKQDDEKYMYYKEIHNLLHCKLCKGRDLIRIGGKNDGGYIMAKPFSKEKVAFSIGIAEDVAWDLDMVSYGYEIFQFDHTIRKLPINNPSFHWKRVGVAAEDKKPYATLENMLVISGQKNTEGMVLKMDVEGAEWDVIANMNEKTLDRFDQIVMELHNLSDISKKDLVLESLRKITNHHALIHIHANNYDRVEWYRDIMLPNTVEVTLVKREADEFLEDNRERPLSIDAPCDSLVPDIRLGKWN